MNISPRFQTQIRLLKLKIVDTNNFFFQYGHKMENGTWTGIVGDLISGEIDISVATLTMTTEREEVRNLIQMDRVPYFRILLKTFLVL